MVNAICFCASFPFMIFHTRRRNFICVHVKYDENYTPWYNSQHMKIFDKNAANKFRKTIVSSIYVIIIICNILLVIEHVLIR